MSDEICDACDVQICPDAEGRCLLIKKLRAENAIQASMIEAMARDLAEKFYYNPQIFTADWNNVGEGTRNEIVANIIAQRRDEIEQAEKAGEGK